MDTARAPQLGEDASFAAEGHQALTLAILAPDPQEGMLQPATFSAGPESATTPARQAREIGISCFWIKELK